VGCFGIPNSFALPDAVDSLQVDGVKRKFSLEDAPPDFRHQTPAWRPPNTEVAPGPSTGRCHCHSRKYDS
jgi:hypothetical protein